MVCLDWREGRVYSVCTSYLSGDHLNLKVVHRPRAPSRLQMRLYYTVFAPDTSRSEHTAAIQRHASVNNVQIAMDRQLAGREDQRSEAQGDLNEELRLGVVKEADALQPSLVDGPSDFALKRRRE